MNSDQQTSNESDDINFVQFTQNVAGLLRNGGTLGSIIDITDTECEAMYTLGHSLYEQAHYAEAMKVFALLVSYNHLEPRYLIALGSAQQMIGRYRDALQQFSAATVMKIDDPLPAFHSAECLMALDFLSEAIETLELVITLCKQDQHEQVKLRAEAMLKTLKKKLH